MEIAAKDEGELLRSPLLKLERAKQHINDLNRKVSEYLADKPFRIRIRQNQDPPWRMVYVHTNPPIPEAHFALIVGDAVHNLRTALDHLCFTMVGDDAPTPERVGFPFAKSAEGLESTISTRQMHIAPKHVIDELHALQPYPGGNKYLHAIKVLDERDKHHFVLTVGYAITFSIDQLAPIIGEHAFKGVARDTLVSTTGGFKSNLEKVEVVTSSFDKDADFQPPFNIGFSQGEALIGEPIVPALSHMLAAAEDALLRLAAAYAR